MTTRFVIMGLPASGKTTFLAALWHLVESDEIKCELRLDSYEGDLAYLNLIAAAWRNFDKVPRTSQVGDKDVVIHLSNRATGMKASAFFPDLAGETFDAQVEARHCAPEFVDALSTDDGIILFVSADVKQDGMSVVELTAALPSDDEEEGDPDALSPGSSPPAAHKLPEWRPRLIPTQVRVVQLLSDLLRPPFEPRPRRLVVMISAWDLARSSGLAPAAWLDEKMPMLAQFLRSNASTFHHRIYGVSAQGISLDDGGAIDKAAKLIPSRRIQIVGMDGDGHDLTSPLVWLMSPA